MLIRVFARNTDVIIVADRCYQVDSKVLKGRVVLDGAADHHGVGDDHLYVVWRTQDCVEHTDFFNYSTCSGSLHRIIDGKGLE